MIRIAQHTVVFICLSLLLFGCKASSKSSQNNHPAENPLENKWSYLMTMSEIKRFPDPTLLDFREKPRWSYTNGLVLQAMYPVYEQSGDEKIYDYIYDYSRLVQEDGSIDTYKLSNYNLDMIKSGDVLFDLYKKTKEPRLKKAMDTLHKQLLGQPTTSEGGYWHKKVYPYQMWLDGVYMAEPFHAKYAKEFLQGEEQKEVFDHIILQFDLIEEHNRDPETGLYYHGWDESKEQRWADPETGLSKNFWSRGMGWYGMALVDVLDYFPKDHPGYERLIKYLQQYAEAIVKVQDSSGTWYQVLDQGDREGNYLEATGSCMFAYTLAKGLNQGYLEEYYIGYATRAFLGIQRMFVTRDANGLVNLNQCCSVAGLGGNPYRDGSYEYYIGEKIRSNDPKGTGPYIKLCLQLDK